MMETDDLERFRRLVRQSSDFSIRIDQWLGDKDPEEQVAWLKRSLTAGRPLMQPWTMEILFSIGILKIARFSQLEALLGIGSKTLTARLKTLQEEGFVERTVIPETPVRIEYSLTKAGGATAALASPLFTELNLLRNGLL